MDWWLSLLFKCGEVENQVLRAYQLGNILFCLLYWVVSRGHLQVWVRWAHDHRMVVYPWPWWSFSFLFRYTVIIRHFPLNCLDIKNKFYQSPNPEPSSIPSTTTFPPIFIHPITFPLPPDLSQHPFPIFIIRYLLVPKWNPKPTATSKKKSSGNST